MCREIECVRVERKRVSVFRKIEGQYVWRDKESISVKREKKRLRVYAEIERGGSVQRDRVCVDTEREIARGCVEKYRKRVCLCVERKRECALKRRDRGRVCM